MVVDYEMIDRYLSGEATPEESLAVLVAIATNPEYEAYMITQKRLDYEEALLRDYSSFIPVSSMAADDGRNLCDVQCERYILSHLGYDVESNELAGVSRMNYWLLDDGTPLYHVGRLLEKRGHLVKRSYDNTLESLKEALSENSVIAVVNGDVLENKPIERTIDKLDNEANHAVVVLSFTEDGGSVKLYNPALGEEVSEYPLEIFENAWLESKHYMVTAKKTATKEYEPQPIDVSRVNLDEDLQELVELLAENAHNVWGVGKIEKAAEDRRILAYDPVDGDRDIEDGEGVKRMRYSHYFVPYSKLSEEDKKPDRDLAISTVKLIKRLGYRLVNINKAYKCQVCGGVLELNYHFCPYCGKELSWEDFKEK